MDTAVFWEVSVMSNEDLRRRVEKLEMQVGMLEDVHAIRRLHHL
jgi:hypothetical protein